MNNASIPNYHRKEKKIVDNDRIHIVRTACCSINIYNHVKKLYNLNDKRQTDTLTTTQINIANYFFETMPRLLNFKNLYGDVEIENDNIWNSDGYILRKLSKVLKWYGINVVYKTINFTDDKKDEFLTKEVNDGKYFIEPEEMCFETNTWSGNFEPLIIFIGPNPLNIRTYILYITIAIKNPQIFCWFCNTLQLNSFRALKCIHINHCSMWQLDDHCSVCNTQVNKEDQIHHYELYHKLARVQFEQYNEIKQALKTSPENVKEEEEENDCYTIVDSYPYIDKVNKSHVTIDISFDYETFTTHVDKKGDSIPYIISLAIGCNYQYTLDKIPHPDLFSEKINSICRYYLELNNFIILTENQTEYFYLDPRQPQITAYSILNPASLKKKIDRLESKMEKMPTVNLTTKQYSEVNKNHVVSLHTVKNAITERFILFLNSLLRYLNYDCREDYPELFGEIEEVIVRCFAYNGARFDNYFIEQYLKFCTIDRINNLFKNRVVLQGKDGITKISLNLSRKKKKNEDDKQPFQVQLEFVDIFKMRAPLSLEKQLKGLNIKDLKFKMKNEGHELMHKIALELEKDVVLSYPCTSSSWNDIKENLLGKPKPNEQISPVFPGFIVVNSSKSSNQKEIDIWEKEFEECIVAHRSLFNNKKWSFTQYYISYGIKDAISCYSLMAALYIESVEYLKKLYEYGMFQNLQRNPLNNDDDDEELTIKSLDYFKLGVSCSGLAFRIWHIDTGTFVQPRGIAASTIRECIIGGFCQPQILGEVKSGEDFTFYNNHFTQIDIVSMYANSQRSNYYADGKCEIGTLKVKEAVVHCNKMLQYWDNIGMEHYRPIFGFYAICPPDDKDCTSLGPIACRIKMIEKTNNWFTINGKKTTENITWCGIPRFQALTPQDACTFKNLGWHIYMLDTKEALSRTVLFEKFSSPIRKFAEIHIQIKLQAKRECNLAMEKLAKLIINGYYGKTLMKLIFDYILTITSAKELTKLYSKAYCGTIKLKNVIECSYSLLVPYNNNMTKIETIYYIVKIESHHASSSGPIHYGAQTLGHSHAAYNSIEINDVHRNFVSYKWRIPSQIYGDTDSWFIQNGGLRNYPSYKIGSFMSEMPENPFHNNQWCVVVEEKEPFGIHGNCACVCGKKSYCYIDDNCEPQKNVAILKVAKGQKVNDLHSEHYRQVIDKKLLPRAQFEELYYHSLKVQTTRLSFLKSLFASNDRSPIEQTTLSRELQVNYTISGNHEILSDEPKYRVRCVPHSASDIDVNDKNNELVSIEILDSRQKLPELLNNYEKTKLPKRLYDACYFHFSEYMKDDVNDVKELKNGKITKHSYRSTTNIKKNRVSVFFD